MVWPENEENQSTSDGRDKDDVKRWPSWILICIFFMFLASPSDTDNILIIWPINEENRSTDSRDIDGTVKWRPSWMLICIFFMFLDSPSDTDNMTQKWRKSVNSQPRCTWSHETAAIVDANLHIFHVPRFALRCWWYDPKMKKIGPQTAEIYRWNRETGAILDANLHIFMFLDLSSATHSMTRKMKKIGPQTAEI